MIIGINIHTYKPESLIVNYSVSETQKSVSSGQFETFFLK